MTMQLRDPRTGLPFDDDPNDLVCALALFGIYVAEEAQVQTAAWESAIIDPICGVGGYLIRVLRRRTGGQDVRDLQPADWQTALAFLPEEHRPQGATILRFFCWYLGKGCPL